MIDIFKRNKVFLMDEDFQRLLKDPCTKIINKELVSAQKMKHYGIYKVNKEKHILFHVVQKISQSAEQNFILPTAFFTLIEWRANIGKMYKKGPVITTYNDDSHMLEFRFLHFNKPKKPYKVLKFKTKGSTHLQWDNNPEKNIAIDRINISHSNKIIEKTFHNNQQGFIPNTLVFDFKKNLLGIVFKYGGEKMHELSLIDDKKALKNIIEIFNDYNLNIYHFDNNQLIPKEVTELLEFNFSYK